jgi:hypothetical protein
MRGQFEISKRDKIFLMNREELKQTLREFIQNDPYIAFFIEFFADVGIDALIGNHIYNPKTQTRITARYGNRKLIITQKEKTISLSIQEAKEIVEELYGRIPFVLV